MKKIAITNFKGGVGKTTTTINLAHLFSRKGLKVLVIDHDSQGNATSGFGVSTDQGTRTLHDSLVDMKGLPIYKVADGIYLCPSDLRLTNIESELYGVKGRVRRLKQLLDEISEEYDVALIDCPPNHGIGSNSSLIAADEVLIPMEASLFSVKGVKDILSTIDIAKEYNNELHLLGMFVNRFRKTSDHIAILSELREKYPELVLNTVVRESSSISISQLNRMSITVARPKSIGALDFSHLADEISSKLNLNNNGYEK